MPGPRHAWVRDHHLLGELVDLTGLSERRFAMDNGLGHATVNHLTSGRRRFCSRGTAEKIAHALGHPVETLFSIVS